MKSAKTPKTVGHHFSDLLICQQRAWLHYHGDHRQKLPPPVLLRTMQAEGQRIEETVYKNRYPDGVLIPGFRYAKQEDRLAQTAQAMHQGAHAILQGYVCTDLGEGTLDVMELVGSDPNSAAGYAYRVGEIKRSATLRTAHIMQVMWYTELLERAYGQSVHEGFFILGEDGTHTQTEDLSAYQVDYEYLKTQLFSLRDNPIDPGPHLVPACTSCEWRGVCMQRMLNEKHLSLAPALSPAQVQILCKQGFLSWESLENVSDETLTETGMGDLEITILRQGVDRLSHNLAPMRQLFKKDLFDDASVAALEFVDVPSSRQRDEPLKVVAIHIEKGSGVISIPVNYDPSGKPQADLSPIVGLKKLIFYGGIDMGPFADIQKNQSARPKLKVVNLVDFIEDYVHFPFTSLALESLTGYLQGSRNRLSGPERVPAIRQVVNWLRSSL